MVTVEDKIDALIDAWIAAHRRNGRLKRRQYHRFLLYYFRSSWIVRRSFQKLRPDFQERAV